MKAYQRFPIWRLIHLYKARQLRINSVALLMTRYEHNNKDSPDNTQGMKSMRATVIWLIWICSALRWLAICPTKTCNYISIVYSQVNPTMQRLQFNLLCFQSLFQITFQIPHKKNCIKIKRTILVTNTVVQMFVLIKQNYENCAKWKDEILCKTIL